MDRRRDYSSGLQNPCVDIDMNTVLFTLGGTDVQRGSRWERRCAFSIRDYIGNLVPTAHGSEEDKNQNDAKGLASPSQLRRWRHEWVMSHVTVCESFFFSYVSLSLFSWMSLLVKRPQRRGGGEEGWGGAWRRERSKKQKTHQKREE